MIVRLQQSITRCSSRGTHIGLASINHYPLGSAYANHDDACSTVAGGGPIEVGAGATVRKYYIAADKIDWDFAPSGK